MNDKPVRRPGDLLLDQIIPNATQAERELAHHELREFGKIVLRILSRVAQEEGTTDSPERRRPDIIYSLSPPP